MKRLLSPAIFLLITFTCMIFSNCSSKYTNRESDKKKAEEIADKLYDNLQKDDIDGVLKLFSEHLNNSPEVKGELFRNLLKYDSTYGKIEKIELVKWNTFVKTGSKPFTQFDLYYKVQRDSGLTTEGVIITNDKTKLVIQDYSVIPNVL